MEIKKVTTKVELAQCLSIRREVFIEEQNVSEAEEIDEFDRSPEACHHWLITIIGQPIGTGRWREYELGTAKLQRIAVRSAYRSQGLGNRIVEAMEADARTLGYRYAILDAQCEAEDFYIKQGYKIITAEPFLDAGIWHVGMRKAL